MSTTPNGSIRSELDQNLVTQTEGEDDGLVEMGKVSETQGGFLGGAIDTGGIGWRQA